MEILMAADTTSALVLTVINLNTFRDERTQENHPYKSYES